MAVADLEAEARATQDRLASIVRTADARLKEMQRRERWARRVAREAGARRRQAALA